MVEGQHVLAAEIIEDLQAALEELQAISEDLAETHDSSYRRRLMATPDSAKRVIALIKWGKHEHLEKLVRGELYLNTAEYYRINADNSFGDKFESCAYSYRAGRDEVAPVLLKDGVPLSHCRTRSATVYTASKQSFYLHCWSMVSAWDDPS